MNKTLIISLGGLGTVGAVGAGSLVVFKPWESKISTFAERYKLALLDTLEDNDSWTGKYNSLKTTKPKHPILVRAYEEAIKKTPSAADDTKAKKLMREGCQEIYKSRIDDENHLSDFKSYCSKTNGDASSSGTWNGDDVSTSSNNKWDTALGSLRTHDENTNKKLDSALLALKDEIKGQTQLTSNHRTTLKNWCDAIKLEPYEGQDSSAFKHQEIYCKHS